LRSEFASGGLIVCGPDPADLLGRAGDNADKILKDTKLAIYR